MFEVVRSCVKRVDCNTSIIIFDYDICPTLILAASLGPLTKDLVHDAFNTNVNLITISKAGLKQGINLTVKS